jgi:hypothetical protein
MPSIVVEAELLALLVSEMEYQAAQSNNNHMRFEVKRDKLIGNHTLWLHLKQQPSSVRAVRKADSDNPRDICSSSLTLWLTSLNAFS